MGFFSKFKKKLKKLAKGAAKVYTAPAKLAIDLPQKTLAIAVGKKNAGIVGSVGLGIADAVTFGGASLGVSLANKAGVTAYKPGIVGGPIKLTAPAISTPLVAPAAPVKPPETNFWDTLDAGVDVGRGVLDLFNGSPQSGPVPVDDAAPPAPPAASSLVPFAVLGAGLVAVALLSRR